MEDFSFNALMALALANKLITGSILSALISLLLIVIYWDKVRYFVMRVWHGIPVIGTVARLARSSTSSDSKGWLLSEVSLSNDYYDYYQEVGDKSSEYYNKCESYLDTIGEGGRRERPAWVLVLVFLLILFEAVGFAYVLVPFINQNLSSNDQAYLGWMAAFLLSIISAGFAEAAGRALHHNSLVNKARHWWEGDADPSKVNPLKQVQPGVRIKETEKDEQAKDYNRILARIVTNQTVTPRHGWIVGCVLVVLIMACAAFGIRAYQLKSIETEMVSSPDVFAQQSYEQSASPFDLPAESASVNEVSEDSALTDKMDAIRSASLITFIVLSVIYVAIQAVSVWLASIFGFAGVESKKAWFYTHKFNNAAELERWMETQRTKIAAHADHKLRMLQMKLAKRTTTNSAVQTAISGAQSRDFNAYVVRMRAEASTHQTQPSPSSVASAVEASPLAEPAAPKPLAVEQSAPTAAPVQQTLEASPAEDALAGLRNKDLTAFSDEQLRTVCTAKGYDFAAVASLRADQQLLKDFDEA
ncbi:hypothetical protein EF096_07325 [Pseudomonas neustonica]|uniref:Uncharacterized protein n=1 Tax=Pseudomonas neustonica TaxID=2487346 RepID=A0ABX9XM10_9PSED|nr:MULTISPECIES: hypothetical protein [Pseudomonas]ROZ83896.1 hypothetical protein EF099_08515 [Pseudomonas sp. SSM44]ROZ85877.1 hypothetical protein EF096_07325 [Pseudomonas neustonica]|tara:strand:- start:4790 stop:6379 length:1590 start_codon:yes stop_codon:yes gene_type:complete